MASKAVEQLKRKRMRTIKSKIRKFLRFVLGCVCTVVILCVVGILSVFIFNTVSTNNEIKMLKEAGLYNLVEVEDGRSINVASYGNVNAKHTIVTISGVGVQDYTVFMQHITNEIKNSTHVALIDRAGYGLSDDSNKKQTVEQIVNDYRTALTNADIEAPYILAAHEFGGVYATYWAIKYPDEIEGIVYLDGTEIIKNTEITSTKASDEDIMKSYAYKIGFHRLSYNDLFYVSSKGLTNEEAKYAIALNANSILTQAYLSERSLMKENFDTVLNMMGETDIPKLYLSSKNAFNYREDVIKYYEYKNSLHEDMGLPPYYSLNEDTEKINNEISLFIKENQNEYEQKTKVFADALGNCVIAKMPGDSKIYEQKTSGMVDVFVDFMEYLDGNKNSIKAYYEDKKAIDWHYYITDEY